MINLPRYELIIFDWDGTLMDSTSLIVNSIHQAFLDCKLPPPSHRESQSIIGLSLPKAFSILYEGLTEDQLTSLISAYHKHYDESFRHTQLFEGVLSGLQNIKNRGVKLAIATGKGQKALHQALELVDFPPHFFCTYRTGDLYACKPDPEMIFSIMAEIHTAPEKILMVGDTNYDLTMANNAGVDSVGLSHGAHSKQQLAACRPVKIFQHFNELTHWLAPLL